MLKKVVSEERVVQPASYIPVVCEVAADSEQACKRGWILYSGGEGFTEVNSRCLLLQISLYQYTTVPALTAIRALRLAYQLHLEEKLSPDARIRKLV